MNSKRIATRGATLVELLVATTLLTTLMFGLWGMVRVYTSLAEKGGRHVRKNRTTNALANLIVSDLRGVAQQAQETDKIRSPTTQPGEQTDKFSQDDNQFGEDLLGATEVAADALKSPDASAFDSTFDDPRQQPTTLPVTRKESFAWELSGSERHLIVVRLEADVEDPPAWDPKSAMPTSAGPMALTGDRSMAALQLPVQKLPPNSIPLRKIEYRIEIPNPIAEMGLGAKASLVTPGTGQTSPTAPRLGGVNGQIPIDPLTQQPIVVLPKYGLHRREFAWPPRLNPIAQQGQSTFSDPPVSPLSPLSTSPAGNQESLNFAADAANGTSMPALPTFNQGAPIRELYLDSIEFGEFFYFDGNTWRGNWDSKRDGLPVAVAFHLWLTDDKRRERQAEASQQNNGMPAMPTPRPDRTASTMNDMTALDADPLRPQSTHPLAPPRPPEIRRMVFLAPPAESQEATSFETIDIHSESALDLSF